MLHWTPRHRRPRQALRVGLADATGCRTALSASLGAIAHTLAPLKAVRYRSDSRTIVQRTQTPLSWPTARHMPKQILSIAEPAQAAKQNRHTPGIRLPQASDIQPKLTRLSSQPRTRVSHLPFFSADRGHGSMHPAQCAETLRSPSLSLTSAHPRVASCRVLSPLPAAAWQRAVRRVVFSRSGCP